MILHDTRFHSIHCVPKGLKISSPKTGGIYFPSAILEVLCNRNQKIPEEIMEYPEMIMVMSEISGDSFPGKITSFVIHPKSILIEMESWWPKIKLLEIFRKEYVHWVLDGNKPLFKLNEIYVTEF